MANHYTYIMAEPFLPAVENLFARLLDSTVHLSWDVPSISNDDNVAITYCVDVEIDRDYTIHTDCALTQTEYTFVLPDRSWCFNYYFTVTPYTADTNGTRKEVPFLTNISRKYSKKRTRIHGYL